MYTRKPNKSMHYLPFAEQMSDPFRRNPSESISICSKNTFAEIQPKDGDPCVHCGHIDGDTEIHFWIIDALFSRPDGSAGKARRWCQK